MRLDEALLLTGAAMVQPRVKLLLPWGRAGCQRARENTVPGPRRD